MVYGSALQQIALAIIYFGFVQKCLPYCMDHSKKEQQQKSFRLLPPLETHFFALSQSCQFLQFEELLLFYLYLLVCFAMSKIVTQYLKKKRYRFCKHCVSLILFGI